jgi:hypothetical protein
MKAVITWFSVVVFLFNLALGAGAGYAALRLWSSRHHPLIWRLGIYLNAFIVDALISIVLLFVARGVRFTTTFAAVMFTGTFISNMARIPLIVYLIKGPRPVPAKVPVSGDLPTDFWLDSIRNIVREEIEEYERRREGQGTTTTTGATG